MKLFTLFAFFLLSFNLPAQRDSLPFNTEFGLSINQFKVEKIAGVSGKTGYGLFMSQKIELTKKWRFVTGLEYNCVRYFMDVLYEGHFNTYSDLTVSMHCIDIPILFRGEFGKKTKCFLEGGFRPDIRILKRVTGTYKSLQGLTFTTAKYNGAFPSSYRYDDKNFAMLSCIGMGMVLTGKKRDFVLKGDYRYMFIAEEWIKNNSSFTFSIGIRFKHKDFFK